MDALALLLPCLKPRSKHTLSDKRNNFPISKNNNYLALSEKKPADDSSLKNEKLTAYEAASQFVSVLQNAEKLGNDINVAVSKIIHQAGGWSQYIATAILATLEKVLQTGSQMNAAMNDAYKKAFDAAMSIEELAREHPVLTGVFCTVVALGILVILAPYVLEALGFAELGPIEGSWAAAWQATYKGFVPKKSLFSFFQRLGMTWKKIILVSGGVELLGANKMEECTIE